jgi:NAD(P)H-flavin reductase
LRRQVARDQLELILGVSEDVRARHRRAGQFVKVRIAGHEGIFAMWNAPHEDDDEPTLRFLLRANNAVGAEAAAKLAVAAQGTKIEVTEPVGPGFGLDRADGRPLHFVATGTAIAPVRAGIEEALLAANPKSISLDFGLRSAEHQPLEGDLKRYQARRIDVHLHFSTVDAKGVLKGTRAQDALLERITDMNALVVAVGQPEMVEELRAAFVKRGGKAEDVVSNY